MDKCCRLGQFNVELLGNLVAAGFSSPGVNKYEATLTAYMPRNSIVQVQGNPMKYHFLNTVEYHIVLGITQEYCGIH